MMEVSTESIYNLIPKSAKEEKKKPIYRSKYNPKAPLTGSTFGLHGTNVTVGKGIIDLKKKHVISSTFGTSPKKPDPTNFLRKGTRESINKLLPEVNSERTKTEAIKPPVPSCNDKPIMGLTTCKNYIVANAIQAIIQTPKNVCTDERRFTQQETYGKVPEYLSEVKAAIEKEKQFVDKCVQEQYGDGTEYKEQQYEVLDEGERQSLIHALKTKWDHVNSTYQKICHRVTIDSLGDIKRKEAQEKELQQLEDDIERLSRPGPIYIRK